MKFRAGILLILFPIVPLSSQTLCKDEFVTTEKNIKKIYNLLRNSGANCKRNPATYLDFGKRAYLAGQYSSSLWSLKKGARALSNSVTAENAEFHYYAGLGYLSQNRLEEAIATLKKIVFHEHPEKIDPDILQKSHMALVQTYYNREKSHDKNVRYLIELFKSRYKTSPYLFTIRSWNTQKYSTN